MLLERIYDEDLAQASYLIGCQARGEAIVVDPRRDIDVYRGLAAKHHMRIAAVTETHIHADYLSGTRELAARTGATMYVSGEGGPEWQYGDGFETAIRMGHGHRIELGNITIEAVHTPGHTPEHLSFLVTDGAQSSEPGYLLTGDFVFVGDVGRPDLLDEAAGGIDTRFAGAVDLFASLRDHFLTLPDYVQVLPAHGSGSACGKALGSVPSTTVGYERHFSWWGKYLHADDPQGFVAELLSGQPDAHAYFGRMKTQNREGPELLGSLSTLREYSGSELSEALDADSAILIDTRQHTEVHAGTVARSLNIPGVAKAASYGAWVVDPDTESRPLILLAASLAEAEEYRDHLVRVGIDTVHGFVTSLAGINLVQPRTIAPAELDSARFAGFPPALVLDVRNASEYADGYIPGATQLSGGRVLWHLAALPDPSAGTIVTYCQSGVRNSVAASALRRAGYDIVELEGSYQGWSAVPGHTPEHGPTRHRAPEAGPEIEQETEPDSVPDSVPESVPGSVPESVPGSVLEPMSASSTHAAPTTILIDARTPEEYASGHIAGSRLIDVTAGEIEVAIPHLDPHAEILLYCRSGNRSGQARELMRAAGFTNVTNLGSLADAATATGLPVVS